MGTIARRASTGNRAVSGDLEGSARRREGPAVYDGANWMPHSAGTASPCAVRSSSSSNTLGGPSSGSAVTVSTSSHAAGVRPPGRRRGLSTSAPEETHWDGHGLPAAVAFTTSAPSMQTTSARRREKPWKCGKGWARRTQFTTATLDPSARLRTQYQPIYSFVEKEISVHVEMYTALPCVGACSLNCIG